MRVGRADRRRATSPTRAMGAFAMAIEHDAVEFLSGVRKWRTIGSPLLMQIRNQDSRLDDAPELNCPRPGHADFAGAMKWLTTDCRETLERASARETAARVAAGALAKSLCVNSAYAVLVSCWKSAGGEPPCRMICRRRS